MNFHTVKRRYLIDFCSKALSKRCFHACCIFHTTSSKQNVFARGSVKKLQRVNTKHFNIRLLPTKTWCCQQRHCIRTTVHENSLSIKKVMNNFLTHPIQIQVQNNQKSHLILRLGQWQLNKFILRSVYGIFPQRHNLYSMWGGAGWGDSLN